MKVLHAFSYWVDRLIQVVMASLLVWMTIVMVMQVFARYLLSSGMPWTEEMARYAMIWLVFIGATVAAKEGSDISIPILEERFPALKKWLLPIQRLCVLIYIVIVAKVGFEAIKVVAIQVSPNMGVSMGIIYSIIPISCVIIGIHLLIGLKRTKQDSSETTGGI